MENGKIFYRSARIAGILVIIVTLLHSTLGIAEVNSAIKVGGILPSMISMLKTVWILSTIAMFLSGTWILFLSRDLGRLQRRAWWQGLLIGIGYTGGSIGAMVWTGIQVHLVAFTFIGLLILIPLVIRAGAFFSNPQQP